MAQVKISDLSVGDWVCYDRGTDAVQIMGIYVRNNQECVVMSDSYYPDGVIGFVEHIKPIPITPEILEKNGFVDYEVGKGWYVLNVADDLRVWLHRNSHDWTFQLMKWSPLATHEIGKVFIKHTHQLQHALRLAGVEKEIEL